MRTSDLPGAQPRYLQMARSLMAEIAAGHYPVGSKLPNELQLCEQFGASRFTVRAAIEQLARAGLVSRKPKVGTIVEAREVRRERQLALSGLHDVQQFGRRTSMRVLSKGLAVVPPGLPAPLGEHEGQTWLHVEGLRSSPESPEPICFNEVWVGPDYRGVSGIDEVLQQSISSLIEEQFGVSLDLIVQDIRATTLDARTAGTMGLRKGSAALLVRRAYFDARKRLVELATSIHPPDSFVYTLRLERGDVPGQPRQRS